MQHALQGLPWCSSGSLQLQSLTKGATEVNTRGLRQQQQTNLLTRCASDRVTGPFLGCGDRVGGGERTVKWGKHEDDYREETAPAKEGLT
jgi:hypothetical protein